MHINKTAFGKQHMPLHYFKLPAKLYISINKRCLKDDDHFAIEGF